MARILFAAGLAWALLASSAHAQAPVYRVPVTGVVELGLAPFIERSLEEAEAAGASAVILDMDTPGGRVDAAQRIADALQDSPVPVYTLVNRRAFSAGALIALATDEIYMRPGSVLGAATPVDGSGEKASEKIVSAMRSEMRALAEARAWILGWPRPWWMSRWRWRGSWRRDASSPSPPRRLWSWAMREVLRISTTSWGRWVPGARRW